MTESLADLWKALDAAASVGRQSVEDGHLDEAREAARIVLSVGSKLHARLGILVDMSRDAVWKAEVDRAVKKASRPELSGQLSIVDALPGEPSKPKPRGKRG